MSERGMKFNSARPTIERMKFIALQLRDVKPFTASDVAKKFEVDRRTIARDMDFMRDRLGYDFAWNAHIQSFVLNTAPIPIL